MKKTVSIFLLVFIGTHFSSCSKDPSVYSNRDYSKFVTIKQGLWGSCIFREGNCQPGSDKGCKTYPVKRTIYIFQLTPNSQTTQLGAHNYPFYIKINTTLVAQTESNEMGFYQIELQSGQYSILINEEGKYYSNSWDNQDNITPVTINLNTNTERHLIIDYKAVY